MLDNVEIVAGVIAIIMSLYAWVKKPIGEMVSRLEVSDEKHRNHHAEINRLRDSQHEIRGTLQHHEGRISSLERKE